MDLLDYVRVLRRGWAVVLAFVVIGLAAGIAITVTTTKIYESSVKIFVATSDNSADLGQIAQGATFTQNKVATYAEFVAADDATKPVANDKAVQGGRG